MVDVKASVLYDICVMTGFFYWTFISFEFVLIIMKSLSGLSFDLLLCYCTIFLFNMTKLKD